MEGKIGQRTLILLFVCVLFAPFLAFAGYPLDYEGKTLDHKKNGSTVIAPEEELTSLDWAMHFVKATEKMQAVTVPISDLSVILKDIRYPKVLLCLGDDVYVVVVDNELDENEKIARLTVINQYERFVIDDISKVKTAFFYLASVNVEGISFYTQICKDDITKGEYPVKTDGYVASIAMMSEYYNVDDVPPEMILAIDDRHKIGYKPQYADIGAGNIDSILSNRTIIADYFGLVEHEIFRGFDEAQLRRRVKGYKYHKNSPVLVHFKLDAWDKRCSFVLDYKYDEDGLQDVETYRYIPRYTAYRYEIDEDKMIDYDGSHLYICSMVAIGYAEDENGGLDELTVYYPYSQFGMGAKVTDEGMTLTNGQNIPEINLGMICGYMFLDKE